MPVILDNGSEELRTWLDPKRYEWSKELQSLLKPFEGGLEVYPVSKDVGKVGNNSPTFIIPIDSKENKSNIANFFGKAGSGAKTETEAPPSQEQRQVKIKKEAVFVGKGSKDDISDKEDGYNHAKNEGGKHVGDNQAIEASGAKRGAEEDSSRDEPPKKIAKPTPKAQSSTSAEKKGGSGGRLKISATSNHTKGPEKTKQSGTRKITQFFGNSS